MPIPLVRELSNARAKLLEERNKARNKALNDLEKSKSGYEYSKPKSRKK